MLGRRLLKPRAIFFCNMLYKRTCTMYFCVSSQNQKFFFALRAKIKKIFFALRAKSQSDLYTKTQETQQLQKHQTNQRTSPMWCTSFGSCNAPVQLHNSFRQCGQQACRKSLIWAYLISYILISTSLPFPLFFSLSFFLRGAAALQKNQKFGPKGQIFDFFAARLRRARKRKEKRGKGREVDIRI